MNRNVLVSMVLGCASALSPARAAEMERLGAMASGGASAQAEAFTNGGASGLAAVYGAQAENRLAPLKAFQPGVSKSRPHGVPSEDRVSKGASRDGEPAAAGKIALGVVLGGLALSFGAWLAAVVMGTMVGTTLVIFMVGLAMMLGGMVKGFLKGRIE